MLIKKKLNYINQNYYHYLLYKIILIIALFFIFGGGFYHSYQFLIDKTKEPIPILTFIGGLIGASILSVINHIATKPRLRTETWEKIPKNLIWDDGNYKCYKVKIINKSLFTAKNCQIKIDVEYKSEDIREYNINFHEINKPGRDSSFFEKDFAPYICNAGQYALISNENLLWDIQPHGENPLEINIPPHGSYLVTIARWCDKGKSKETGGGNKDASYFKILSEGENNGEIKARVYLKDVEDINSFEIAQLLNKGNGVENTKKPAYELTIKILGENFYPVSTTAILKNNL